MSIRPLLMIGTSVLLLSACTMSSNSSSGVPLSELDLGGPPPDGVALAGADRVQVIEGQTLSITMEGSDEAKQQMRFEREDNMLVVSREGEGWNDSSEGAVTVTIIVPQLRHAVIGGSGQLDVARLSGDATATIGGAGTLAIEQIEASDLTVTIGGSGTVRGSGTAQDMTLSIGGSGDAELDGLEVGSASVNIGGSGSARFASDGEVNGNIAGSGDVRVTGNATCRQKSVGSGSLICG